MEQKRFFKVWLLVLCAALAVVALGNLLVDPIGAYPKVHLPSFARFRDTMNSRLARAELARRGSWDMIVLGSSRPKIGLPSDHPVFSTNRACNLSIDGARMSELAAIFDYTLERNPVRRVLFCVDLFVFREGPKYRFDFPDSRFNPEFPRFEYHCKNIVGAAMTEHSWEFLLDAMRGKQPPAAERNGFAVRTIRPGASQRRLFERSLRALAYGYSVQRTDPAQMAEFRRVLRVCRDRGIELTVAMNPVHALDLELLRGGGNFERMEQWKRDFVQLIAEESMADRVPVWDFMDYAGPPAEEVPPLADETTRMTYYVENSHYTPALGALLLDRMFAGAPGEFGERITTANIETHLARIREHYTVYARTHAADIAWVHGISAKVLASRGHRQADPEGAGEL